jgi:hypothetical protein
LLLFDHFDFVSRATIRQSYPDGARALFIPPDSRGKDKCLSISRGRLHGWRLSMSRYYSMDRPGRKLDPPHPSDVFRPIVDDRTPEQKEIERAVTAIAVL